MDLFSSTIQGKMQSRIIYQENGYNFSIARGKMAMKKL